MSGDIFIGGDDRFTTCITRLNIHGNLLLYTQQHRVPFIHLVWNQGCATTAHYACAHTFEYESKQLARSTLKRRASLFGAHDDLWRNIVTVNAGT